jgi:hypothetical protein
MACINIGDDSERDETKNAGESPVFNGLKGDEVNLGLAILTGHLFTFAPHGKSTG